MPTGIRFPSNFLPPDRDDAQSEYENPIRQFEPEIGSPRQRRKSTVQPRLEKVVWTFSQDAYRLFDQWWTENIRNGELEFDIELSDDDGGLQWYTAQMIGGFEAQIDYSRYEWRVSTTLRLLSEPFDVRLPGTNELRTETTVGIASATGILAIAPVLRGRATVGISSVTGRFSFGVLRGLSTPGLLSGRAFFGPIPITSNITVGVATATGNLGPIPVLGAADIDIGNTGSLGPIPVRGAADIGIDGTGDLRVGVALGGNTEVGIDGTGDLQVT